MDSYAIVKTMAEYSHSIDDGRLDDLAALFAQNAVLNIPSYSIRIEGRAAIREQFGKMWDPNVKGTHCAVNPEIDVSGNSATGIFDFMWLDLNGPPKLGPVGRYRCKFIKESDRWRFQEFTAEVRSQFNAAQN